MSSQTIRRLYGNHLRRQIELADIDIQYKKKKMENLALESQIKKRTIRKLDLEIKKLEREIVCNADCVISNVVAKWPGSVHDSRIFRASEIYQHLSQGEFSGVLLGDRGYGCQPFLLTPFTDPQEAGLQPRPCPDQGQS
ncbi:uncharacterized protein LOC132855432 isoform X2 [Tachysurus vachellii]|uniref:uncharacterized protein LOC132855432 isoform X2 n=1 Tax=Tachysurus vachellii TaxID=175792 RepID=UPI00296AA0CE|nr:uncharacterized protein LOC132855432 isoform X2 [Tachysurus vachellii]